jgi:large subunit ribosomal protein L30
VAEAKNTQAQTAAPTQATNAGTLKITWVRSWIGYDKGQRDTIKSLGLHHLNQTVEQPDNPQIRGQINKVRHMLRVEEPSAR